MTTQNKSSAALVAGQAATGKVVCGGDPSTGIGWCSQSTACAPQSTTDADETSSSQSESNRSTASKANEGSPRQRRQPEAAVAPGKRQQDMKTASPAPKKGVLMSLLHLTLFYGCLLFTRVILTVRTLLAIFVSGAQRAPVLKRPEAQLTWELLSTAADPCLAARSALPVPPPFPMPPPEGITMSFAPCANLMIYLGGVAACLQRCPNYAEVSPRIRFYGVSCGAFIASSMAADCDILDMLPEMLSWTRKFKARLWGLIGAYSESISSIVWSIFSDPMRFERAKTRLGIGLTAWQPMPGRVEVSNFDSAKELVSTVLGSCYIPVAFETPQWSQKLGPVWDGGIFEFATQGDYVFSPWEVANPDVLPELQYPKSFTFFPPHECDAVHIFEDGYMDCLRWLQKGAPNRSAERQKQLAGRVNGIQPLLVESKRFLYEILFSPHSNTQQ